MVLYKQLSSTNMAHKAQTKYIIFSGRVSNALKFTRRSRVEICYEKKKNSLSKTEPGNTYLFR